MNLVLDWVKSNVFTVVFLVLMIVALAVLPILANRMNSAVQEDVTSRASLDRQLDSLSKTQVTVPQGVNQPPFQQAMLINDSFIEQLREVTDALRADADQAQQVALEHNRAGHEVLLPELFPEPDPRQREVLPRQFYERLSAAYDDLLGEIKAGSPPTVETLREDIQQRRAQLLSSDFNKGLGDELTAEEQDRLSKSLTAARIGYCHEQAANCGIFVSLDALGLPVWDQTRQYTLTELFQWQWQYWLYEDVLRGLAAANAESDSVLKAPVKRLVWAQVWTESDAETTGGTSGGGGSPPAGGGMGFGAAGGAKGGRGAGGGADTAADQTPKGPPIPPDPNIEAPIDVGTITGRRANPLYDVRYVDLEIVVETTCLPEVLDALAKQNFISVLDLKMNPVDPYEHLAAGFYYGVGPISAVRLTLETIWFRQWTAPHMPYALRQAKGIQSQPVESAATPGG
ncbi:MAG: hypothetical protein JSV91_09755 [Phycisphaerales bacterium]|nr:MAG: hypothetical protein JSV91_09755 [Phycisphaerales bacterium]